MARAAVLLPVLVLLAAGCGGSDDRVVGVFAGAAQPDGARFRQGIDAAAVETP